MPRRSRYFAVQCSAEAVEEEKERAAVVAAMIGLDGTKGMRRRLHFAVQFLPSEEAEAEKGRRTAMIGLLDRTKGMRGWFGGRKRGRREKAGNKAIAFEFCLFIL